MKKYRTPLLEPKDRARGKMLVAKEENPPPAENCLLERQSRKGPPHQPPVRTKPGALSPPRATRGGATRKILWVNLLKARTIWKIPKKNPSNPPQSHPSPEPASIPWHLSGLAERVGQSGRGDKDPCGTSGEGLAVRQDWAARVSSRGESGGNV